MLYDEVLLTLGQFGGYQKRVYFLLCLPVITSSMQTFMSLFSLAVPPHRCAIPGLHNDTFTIQDSHHAALINATIPPGDSCHVLTSHYVTNPAGVDVSYGVIPADVGRAENGGSTQGSNGSQVVLMECSRFVYDRTLYEENLVTEMGLVCEKASLRTTVQTVMMTGFLTGALLFQPLSDFFGRHKMLMAGLLMHVAATAAMAWATYLPLFCCCMFLNGLAAIAIFGNGFVIGLEMVGSKKRVWAGYVMEMFWSLGMILLAPMAYLLRHWQHLQIASAVLPFAFLSYFWLIPESPRWLLTKGRVAEAEAILMKAARVNRVVLPAGCVDVHSVARDRKESLRSVCSHPVLVYRCSIIFLTWFVCSLGFYGLSLNVGSLSGSVYLNVMLSGLMEIVAFSLCIAFLDRLGRRPLNASLLLLAGLACTSTIFTTLYAPTSLSWTTTALAMIGKLGIAGAFATIWLYSTELFPTVVRNSSMGVSSAFARVGNIVSPYIDNLSDYLEGDAATAVPLLIFGSLAIMAGLLLLILPETLNRRLPDTITDAIQFTKVVGDTEVDGFHSVPQDEKSEENGTLRAHI